MKNLLICVCGLTPQIITETFYCLAVKEKIKIDELYVITTTRGRNIIYGSDLEYNKKRGYPPFISELSKLCKKYSIKRPKFAENDSHVIVAKEQTVELSDIRNDAHNRLFPNKVCEVIRKKTSDKDNTLYCSISGGRKTMSVDLAIALSLFGRGNDKLFHVLTDEKLEFAKFFPESKKEDKMLQISEVPYVRLRPLITDMISDKRLKLKQYTDIVNHTQLQLKLKTADKLYIDTISNKIRFADGEWIKMQPAQINLYLYMIEAKRRNKEYININELSEQFYGKSPGHENVQTRITRLNKDIRKAIPDIETQGLFTIEGPDVYGIGNHGIYASYDMFEIIS